MLRRSPLLCRANSAASQRPPRCETNDTVGIGPPAGAAGRPRRYPWVATECLQGPRRRSEQAHCIGVTRKARLRRETEGDRVGADRHVRRVPRARRRGEPACGSMTNSTRTREAPAGAFRVFIHCRSRLTHPDPDQGRAGGRGEQAGRACTASPLRGHSRER